MSASPASDPVPADPAGPADAAGFSARLLDWYDRNRRTLPWRAPPGARSDPYHVWLSEIMLQQTTVVAVAGYFQDFLTRWPTVADLAAADLDSVLQAWAGLGYYARARNLHRCARVICERYGGAFPDDETELRRLPGIGDYTAAAVAAIAFDRPAAVMDGNVERVMSRLFAVRQPLPAAKPTLKRLTVQLTPPVRPGDHAQAMMDLGATLCTPRKPKCILCPAVTDCAARALGIAEDLPAKVAKPPKPTRRAIAFWTVNGAGEVLLRRRPEKGLLGGMMEVPASPWQEAEMPTLDAVRRLAPAPTAWRLLPGLVRHTFTHFHLELKVAAGRVPYRPSLDGRWVPLDALGEEALPTVMRKIISHALAKAAQKG